MKTFQLPLFVACKSEELKERSSLVSHICQSLEKKKKYRLLFASNLYYGQFGELVPLEPAVHFSSIWSLFGLFPSPELPGHSVRCCGSPSHVGGVNVLTANAFEDRVGTTVTTRTAARPIARNIAFLFITRFRNKYDKTIIGKE
jgi:hypothetical protein